MGIERDDAYWLQRIDDMISRSTETAPTKPGLYRLPCGKCYVDFFLASDGTERWLIPGDERRYTRETVATLRHGDYPWERMYTLAQAARAIRQQAADAGSTADEVLTRLAMIADAEDAAEDEEIARIGHERAGLEETALRDVARRFGVELDEL